MIVVVLCTRARGRPWSRGSYTTSASPRAARSCPRTGGGDWLVKGPRALCPAAAPPAGGRRQGGPGRRHLAARARDRRVPEGHVQAQPRAGRAGGRDLRPAPRRGPRRDGEARRSASTTTRRSPAPPTRSSGCAGFLGRPVTAAAASVVDPRLRRHGRQSTSNGAA